MLLSSDSLPYYQSLRIQSLSKIAGKRTLFTESKIDFFFRRLQPNSHLLRHLDMEEQPFLPIFQQRGRAYLEADSASKLRERRFLGLNGKKAVFEFKRVSLEECRLITQSSGRRIRRMPKAFAYAY